MWGQRTLIEDILAHAVDDWPDAGWVYQIAGRSGLSKPSQLQALSIGLIAEVLAGRLMVAGEFDGKGFRPWDCSPGEAILRISEDWLAWGSEPPTPGAIVWLSLTPEGEALGQAVLRRESGSAETPP